jgi:hypothetical protein
MVAEGRKREIGDLNDREVDAYMRSPGNRDTSEYIVASTYITKALHLSKV